MSLPLAATRNPSRSQRLQLVLPQPAKTSHEYPDHRSNSATAVVVSLTSLHWAWRFSNAQPCLEALPMPRRRRARKSYEREVENAADRRAAAHIAGRPGNALNASVIVAPEMTWRRG